MSKKGDYVALVIDFEADYESFVNKAARMFPLEANKCSLVHTNGTYIVEGIVLNNKRQPWCIGRYLQFAYARTSGVKLGIFHEDESIEVMVYI